MQCKTLLRPLPPAGLYLSPVYPPTRLRSTVPKLYAPKRLQIRCQYFKHQINSSVRDHPQMTSQNFDVKLASTPVFSHFVSCSSDVQLPFCIIIFK